MDILRAFFGTLKSEPEAVFDCAKRGDLVRLRALIGDDPDKGPQRAPTVTKLEWTDEEQMTPLCHASLSGNTQIMELLLAKGACIMACSAKREGGTPIHEAASRQAEGAVRLLLQNGADPFMSNRHRESAYDIAMIRNNVRLIRTFEQRAKFSAYVSVKMSAFMGLRGEYRDRWMVLIAREPAPTVTAGNRVTHSQLLMFQDHMSGQAEVKLWTDGAIVEPDPDVASTGKHVLRLHYEHHKPNSLRVESDEKSRHCISLRPSSKPGHEGQLLRLAGVINDTFLLATRSPSVNAAAAQQHRIQQPAPAVASTSNASHVAHAQPTPSAPVAAAAAAIASTSAAQPSAPPVDSTGSGVPEDEQIAWQLQQEEMQQAGVANLQHAIQALTTGSGRGKQEAQSSCAASVTTSVPPPGPAVHTFPPAASTVAIGPPDEDLCIICMAEPKKTGFVHAGYTHLCACPSCAQQWFNEKKTCPVCGIPSDMLIDVYS